MAKRCNIKYNGKVYSKSELLNELGISQTLWDKCVRLTINYIRKNNLEEGITDDVFYSLVIKKVIERKQDINSRKERKDNAIEQRMDKPVHITKYVFYTFKDVSDFIGHDAFNYYYYMLFKQNRKTAYSVEDFIAYLYREDESFKLRLLYVTEVIDGNLYRMASRYLNEYVIAHTHYSYRIGDTTTYEKISADDAIKIAYGKMNYDNSKHQITSILTNRWVVNQYTDKEKKSNAKK